MFWFYFYNIRLAVKHDILELIIFIHLANNYFYLVVNSKSVLICIYQKFPRIELVVILRRIIKKIVILIY